MRQVRTNRVLEKVPERSGKVWCRATSGLAGFRRRFRRDLARSRASFNVPEKVLEGFGAQPGWVQGRSGEGSGRLWWSAGPASTRFRQVLERPGSTRLQVGSGAIPGVYRRSF